MSSKSLRFMGLLVAAAMLMTLVIGVGAQDMPGPGEGGPIVWGNQRGSGNIDPLIPLRCSGVDCADLTNLMYPGLVAFDVRESGFTPVEVGNPYHGNALATGWEISDDGLEWTFTLRDDLVWNDGTPVTALDIYFFWAALKNVDPAETSASYAPAARDIIGAEVIDPYTLKFTFAAANCLALNRSALPAIPAHAFGFSLDNMADFDWTSLIGSEFDDAPPVTAGPFQFARKEAGTAIYLQANPNYAIPSNGQYVVPAGLVYLDVPDYNVMAERLIANQPGDVNYMNEPDTAVLPTLLNAEANGLADVFSAPGRLWHYVSVNVANPANPQPGLDENGNPIPQDPHPILGDVRVRQAMQHAINIDEIINGPVNGNGAPMVAGTIPTAFTIHPTLERRAFDLDAARALLDAAGFVPTGDPLVAGGDGLRTCQGCLYAEEGTPMVLDILNPGDVRNDVSILLQAQMAPLGIQLNVRPLDFNALYDDNLGVQTYDLAVAGWRGALPFDPDQRSFFGAQNDIPSSESPGFNFGSWYNAEFEELSERILTMPGCDQEAIKEAAWRVQEIMWEEQPYLWLYAFNSSYVVNAQVVEGFEPYSNFGWWNMDAWVVAQ